MITVRYIKVGQFYGWFQIDYISPWADKIVYTDQYIPAELIAVSSISNFSTAGEIIDYYDSMPQYIRSPTIVPQTGYSLEALDKGNTGLGSGLSKETLESLLHHVPEAFTKSPHKCRCEWRDVYMKGCSCGGV